ncbi:unnamed protein product, partial [Brenthis ino]
MYRYFDDNLFSEKYLENVDKSPSIWDTYCHIRPNSTETSNGDIACDSYNLWKEDVKIISDLGLDFYRFSISWTRILPRGTPEYISKSGYRYYSNLIDALLENGIEPVVTMYHWDLPQRFQNMGGWANPLISDWFADYSRVLFTLFGDRVKTWITLNEPFLLCLIEYSTELGTGPADYDIGNFQCIKNSMIAHAKAWRVYDEEFKKKFKGRVGMTNLLVDLKPATKEDELVTQLAVEFYSGLFTYPIYSKTGGWPSAIENLLAQNSKKKGYRQSRLPAFTDEEKEFVRGTGDFIGMNYYTSKIVRTAKEHNFENNTILEDIPELNVILDSDPSWKKSCAYHLDQHPEGLRSMLSWIKKSFGDIEIVIFENGYATSASSLHDQDRVSFFKKHLEQVLLAIYEDKVNVTGFTVWSLMDVYEWMVGYKYKFGLYEVDFTSPSRTRTPRDSARYYKHVIRNRSIDPPNDNYISDELYLCYFFSLFHL